MTDLEKYLKLVLNVVLTEENRTVEYRDGRLTFICVEAEGMWDSKLLFDAYENSLTYYSKTFNNQDYQLECSYKDPSGITEMIHHIQIDGGEKLLGGIEDKWLT